MDPINSVIEQYDGRSVKLAVSVRDGFVVIEGDRTSLEFLAAIIAAQAGSQWDDSYFIAPKGPGSDYFVNRKGLGIYIQLIMEKETP